MWAWVCVSGYYRDKIRTRIFKCEWLDNKCGEYKIGRVCGRVYRCISLQAQQQQNIQWEEKRGEEKSPKVQYYSDQNRQQLEWQ